MRNGLRGRGGGGGWEEGDRPGPGLIENKQAAGLGAGYLQSSFYSHDQNCLAWKMNGVPGEVAWPALCPLRATCSSANELFLTFAHQSGHHLYPSHPAGRQGGRAEGHPGLGAAHVGVLCLQPSRGQWLTTGRGLPGREASCLQPWFAPPSSLPRDVL